MIYPEGTRSRDGKLQPFKKGAFRIAIDHDLAVVPVAIQGTREAWPPGSKFIYGGKVRAVIHDPITTEGLKPKDADELMKRVRSIILESVSELERQS
jgi:1-acyl-sn-glycerol-3-phosphate acyltransferase